MDVSLIADTAAQGLGFANSIIHCNNLIANSQHLSAVILDAIAPPTVKSSSVRTVRRNRVRRRRRTRRKTYLGGESDDGGDAGEELGFYGGDGGGLTRGGGGSWSGGGGWNFNRFGGQNRDESSWFGSCEFAYGFVYEVIY